MDATLRGITSRWLAVGAGLVALLIGLTAVSSANAESAHHVQPGDTLSGIAAHYGLTVQQIADHNGIANPNFIIAGTTLAIPGGAPAAVAAPVATSSHVVAPGDTLSGIAAYFGVSIQSIVDANALANANFIVAGQVLAIPGGGPAYVPYHAETALRAAAREWGIPETLMLALAWQESGWQQEVTSWAGAVGLTQLMPETAAWVEQYYTGPVDWRYDANQNARVGAAYLSHLLLISGGDQAVALASYYQGWYSVATVGFYDDTHGYVDNILYFANHVFQ